MIDRVKKRVFPAVVKGARWIRKQLSGLGGVDITIDRYASSERHRSVEGWIAAEEEIEAVEMKNGPAWQPAESLVPHPDLTANTGGGNAATPRSFSYQAERAELVDLTFRVRRQGRWTRHRLRRPAPDCTERLDVPDGSKLFDQFIRDVNERHLRVLEIGSRIVSPGSKSKRALFPGAASFTGLDFYPDENTDLVGDAHTLSELVDGRTFDAVFSIAVLEHLAMPWVVAREINRVLTVGGITYHGTVFAWPTHERPWDFWRLSDDGLKVLFSPALGFEVLGAGLFDPVRMDFRAVRPGYAGFPHAAAFASSAILARKQADLEPEQFRWPSDVSAHMGGESRYPEP